MSQHFLLSAKARTLSLSAIMRMSDDKAHARFEQIRFAANGGAAFCPSCECTKVYAYASRKIWKCAACGKQFSVPAGRSSPAASSQSGITLLPSPFSSTRSKAYPPCNSAAIWTYNTKPRS